MAQLTKADSLLMEITYVMLQILITMNKNVFLIHFLWD